MRSDFSLLGVPSTREGGNASLVGGPSNRPMCAGFADSSFLIVAEPSYTVGVSLGSRRVLEACLLVVSSGKPSTINVHFLNRIISNDCLRPRFTLQQMKD